MYPFVRCGIALALNKLSQYLNESQVTPLFLFFVPDALNDRDPEVRRAMLDAALSALNTHGKVLPTYRLKLYENTLLCDIWPFINIYFFWNRTM